MTTSWKDDYLFVLVGRRLDDISTAIVPQVFSGLQPRERCGDADGLTIMTLRSHLVDQVSHLLVC